RRRGSGGRGDRARDRARAAQRQLSGGAARRELSMKRPVAVALALAAAGCTQSGTGVLLTVGGSAVVDQLAITATFGGHTLVRTAPDAASGPLALPLTLLASLPDDDTTVSLVVDGRLAGIVVATGAVGPLDVAAHQVASASVTLDSGSVDLAGVDFGALDLAVVKDASPPDFTAAPDLAPSWAPSHLDLTYWSGTATLTINSSIDTDLLQVDGASPTSGTMFSVVNSIAVLQVGTLVISGTPVGNSVNVRGSRALIIAASQNIQIDGILDGSGQKDASDGPGAFGPRNGCNGMWSAANGTGAGGGGGGYASAGGNGGDSGDPLVTGAAGGNSANNANITSLVGGATGGGGAAPPSGVCSSVAQGGGGGGALQLSTLGSLTITNAMAGITVGGAGGRPGLSGCPGNSGAGGGSGGAILLESPSITVLNGMLRATGGGGGGAGSGAGRGRDSTFDVDCGNIGGTGVNPGGA